MRSKGIYLLIDRSIDQSVCLSICLSSYLKQLTLLLPILLPSDNQCEQFIAYLSTFPPPPPPPPPFSLVLSLSLSHLNLSTLQYKHTSPSVVESSDFLKYYHPVHISRKHLEVNT